MITATRIFFHNMDRSPAIETQVASHLESLDRFYQRITDCQVSIEAPHQHHHKGGRYKVLIKISVPGETLVVSHEDESNPAHEDCYVALHDAFRSARRQLQDYARIQRHQDKREERTSKRKFRSELARDENNGK
jgi:ribosomal subunit interface protein